MHSLTLGFLQYPLFTVGVMDDQNNLIPVAWHITEEASGQSIQLFLRALVEKGRSIDTSFSFGCALSDDDAAEHFAIRSFLDGGRRLGLAH